MEHSARLKEIIEKIEVLSQEIAVLKEEEQKLQTLVRHEFMERTLKAMAELNIPREMLLSSLGGVVAKPEKPVAAEKEVTTRGPVLPKYRAPNGETWSGRGKLPKWMKEQMENGKQKEDFLIKDQA